jgi:hypothetical protein
VLDASFFSHVGGTMNVVVRRNEALFNYSFAVIERPSVPAVTTHVAPPVDTTYLLGFPAREKLASVAK